MPALSASCTPMVALQQELRGDVRTWITAATVIPRGLVTATLLNLFVVPSLYLHFAQGRRSRKPIPNQRGRLAD